MAVWLCVLIGCFLSILTVAAEALPSDSGFTSMRTVVLSKSSSVQEDRHDTTSFSVYYRSAVSKIERGFRNNSATLKAATEGLRSIVYNGNLRIYKVYIIGAASPEGRPELNARLARDRAEGVKAFLKSHVSRMPTSLSSRVERTGRVPPRSPRPTTPRLDRPRSRTYSRILKIPRQRS